MKYLLRIAFFLSLTFAFEAFITSFVNDSAFESHTIELELESAQEIVEEAVPFPMHEMLFPSINDCVFLSFGLKENFYTNPILSIPETPPEQLSC